MSILLDIMALCVGFGFLFGIIMTVFYQGIISKKEEIKNVIKNVRQMSGDL
jgi:hypothetical protein